MEVQIISKETVKPFSSTPQHLRTYNFNIFDQLAPLVYVPVVLFYSSAGELSEHLKTSFAKTLIHFYPLAGRIKDGLTIDCNDEGAEYIEARVAGDMSIVLQEPELHVLEKLLPMNPHDISPETSSQVMLAAQVSHFDCGGIAIGVCIWHAIADASAVASFITSWAAVACGADTDFHGVDFDSTSLFSPQYIQGFSFQNNFNKDPLSNNLTKRFVFESCKLADLRDEFDLRGPTRVEAVAAVIWGALMAATNKDITATMAVGLRKRMRPQLPPLSLGNIWQLSVANFESNVNKKHLNYNGLAAKLHESIVKMSDDNVGKIHAGDRYFKFLKEKNEEYAKNLDRMMVFCFSSWCRFPFYEADFGWGKPNWVTSALKLHNMAILMDTRDGEGIEAWVSLPEEDMVKFEQSPIVCGHASFKPCM